MRVFRREDRGGHWCYRRTVRKPDGSKMRIQGRAPPLNTKASAETAEHNHVERVLHSERFPDEPSSSAPPFIDFADDFLRDYAQVHNKPSEAKQK